MEDLKVYDSEDIRIYERKAFEVWDGEERVFRMYRTEVDAMNKVNAIKNKRKKKKRDEKGVFKKRGANKNYPIISELDAIGIPVEFHQQSCYRIDEMGKTTFFVYPKSDKWFNVKEQKRGTNIKDAVLKYFNYI